MLKIPLTKLKINKQIECPNKKDINEKAIYIKLPSKKIIKKIRQSLKNKQNNIIYKNQENKENENSSNINNYNIKNLIKIKVKYFLIIIIIKIK